MSTVWQAALTSMGASLAVVGYLRSLERDRLDPDLTRVPLALALAGGMLGARAAFGLEQGLEAEEMLRPDPGGWILYGALPGLAVFALGIRLRGVRPSPYLDRAAPWILLVLVPGRIGCWLAGCCDGVPLGIPDPLAGLEPPRVPTALLAAAANGLLAWSFSRRVRSGRSQGTAALALAAHGGVRAVLDPLRERSVTAGGAALVLMALALLRSRRSRS